MIVLGDIACPTLDLNKKLASVFAETSLFTSKNMVCNLEGLVCDEEVNHLGKPVLYNHSTVIETLANAGVKAVSLANNHTLDLAEQFDQTMSLLDNNHIIYNGAGRSREEAGKNISFDDHDQKIIVLSSCWDFLLYHQKNPHKGIYIHTINQQDILKDVKNIREKDKTSKIMIYVHWSFDLEIIPFPMYRLWSRALIDEGADFIVGCHSHCVQGGEKYKNGYIVYGLGNFYLPNGVFAGGTLRFPEFAKIQLAFEYDSRNGEARCHWFRYNEDHTLTFHKSELFEDSELLKEYSPFQNMDDQSYIGFYKRNRRKKMLVPVYKNHKNIFTNLIYTQLLKVRAKFARFLAEKKVIKWQN